MAVEQHFRVAVIGAGAAVFNMHRAALQLPEVQIVGMADLLPDPAQERAHAFGAPFFVDYAQMLAAVRPQVAVVMVPHTFHAEVAIACLRAGCDVLVEKPIARQVSEADAMIAASAETGHRLAVVFQHRFRPEIRAAHAIIGSGAIGEIQHVEMTAFWTRTAGYYRSAGWRGTWAGEGGGVLMNQAPHHLDLLCHLIGLPGEVFAATRTLHHAIQTEDTVQAQLEWPGGALGALHASTAEAGPAERIQIVGTRGILEIASGSLRQWRFPIDVLDHLREGTDPFAKLPMAAVEVELPPGTGDHAAVYRQFLAAIQTGGPFTDGVAGRMSLELANACILSSHTQAPVQLPIDRAAYADLLARLSHPTMKRGLA